MIDRSRKFAAVAAVVVLAACATVGTEPLPAAAPADPSISAHSGSPTPRSIMAGGYLKPGMAPDSLLLNPPPPAAGSAAQARDEEGARAALALRGSARWDQATVDALLFTPTVTDIFSCAAGLRISSEATPKLDALLRKSGPDLGLASYPTKRRYQRPRPFMVNGEPTCTPQDEAMLRRDGSYPSGHSAIGFGWGLILAQVLPDRAGELIARGRAFGDSRRVCNVHWLSDVEEGRVVATAVFARMQSEPAYLADVEAARAEVAALRGKAPAPDCAREHAALGGG